MKNSIFNIIFVICINLYSANQNIELQFDHLTMKNGLSIDFITKIMQSSTGFLWIGTQDGLNRYDGYTFHKFMTDIENPHSISSNQIAAIHEDHNKTIWIGTEAGGLNRFDKNTETFKSYQYDPEDSSSLSHNTVTVLYEDRSEILWIGTEGGGFNRFDPATEKFIAYRKDPNDPNSLSHNMVRTICDDSSKTLWIGTDDGLNRWDREHNEWRCYRSIPGMSRSLSNNAIRVLYVDRSGTLWIGTENGVNRLMRFENNTAVFKRYLTDPGKSNNYSIRTFFEDRSGEFWIGTWGKGMYRLDRNTGELFHYQNNPNDLTSLSSNDVLSIYEDKCEVLWVGTANGLNRCGLRKKKFGLYDKDPFDSKHPEFTNVHAIFVDHSGELWIGGRTMGLCRMDTKNKQSVYYRHDPRNPGSLPSNDISTIYEDHKGIFWMGTPGKGLIRLTFADQERSIPIFTHYTNKPDNPKSISDNSVLTICEDPKRNLWISTRKGLNRLDRKTSTFIRYMSDSQNPNSLSNNVAYTLYVDHLGQLWIGTFGGGLDRFDYENERFIHYLPDEENPDMIRVDNILCIYEDKSHRLWVGTYGKGLNQLDQEKNNFIHYQINDGLPSNVIYGILEDDHGNLWLSTSNGVSKFNPETKTFKNYTIAEGLQSEDFNGHSYFKSRSGEMFFGGKNGANYFYPDSIKDNPHIPPLVITDLQISNKSVHMGEWLDGRIILEKPITLTNAIRLSYTDRVISFEFAALDFVSPDKNQYAYIMEGFEKDWNYIGNRRFVTYTNLSPGHYVFRVKGSNNDGIWNETGASIKITIPPPFWQTWWFRIASGFIVIISIFIAYRIRVRSIENHRKELAIQVRERTLELEDLTAKLKASNEDLEQFAYVASHDLQEPIRMVSSYVTLLSRDYKGKLDSTADEFINYAVDGATRMHLLINDLLSYSRVASKGKPFEKVDMNSIMKQVLMDLKVMIEECQGKVHYDTLPVISGDPIQLERLLQNLIGNAVKYRGEKPPEVYVRVNEEKEKWIFSIKDNGIGIDPKYKDRIFEIFQRLHARDQYSGTGIGLAVCKKIVERHGGRIWVESEEGKGSVFKFTIQNLNKTDL